MAAGVPGVLPSSFHSSRLSLCRESGWRWECWALGLEGREGRKSGALNTGAPRRGAQAKLAPPLLR